MSESKDKEIYYCTHCGATNKKSAVECTECEKKIITKYRPFYDFLKNHSKQEAGEKAVDTVFGLIRRFLMSHIYGIVLTVSIVVAGVATVQGMDSHIKEVTEPQTAQIVETQSENKPEEKEPEEQTFELTDDDLYAFEHLTCNYDSFVDEFRTDGYWNQDIKYYNNASEMYAENNIEDFDYGGVHEMISNPIDIGFNLVSEIEDLSYECRHSVPSTALAGSQCTTEIAKRLHADGYKVAECNYMLNVGTGEHDGKTHTGGTDVSRLVYKFVFVENDGDWYIVEDRLVERLNL